MTRGAAALGSTPAPQEKKEQPLDGRPAQGVCWGSTLKGRGRSGAGCAGDTGLAKMELCPWAWSCPGLARPGCCAIKWLRCRGGLSGDLPAWAGWLSAAVVSLEGRPLGMPLATAPQRHSKAGGARPPAPPGSAGWWHEQPKRAVCKCELQALAGSFPQQPLPSPHVLARYEASPQAPVFLQEAQR